MVGCFGTAKTKAMVLCIPLAAGGYVSSYYERPLGLFNQIRTCYLILRDYYSFSQMRLVSLKNRSEIIYTIGNRS